MSEPRPDEVITVYHCHACEMTSVAGDISIHGGLDRYTGDKLACHRCGTPLSAENFHDFVDIDVVDYE